MKKLLFCLGVTKGGTTWLHWALSQHAEVVRIPRKEIHYFLRQYGGIDRLTDKARAHQFLAYMRHVSVASSKTKDLGRSEITDIDLVGSPWDQDMAEAWAEGGQSFDRYQGITKTIDWYKKYLRGPIDDEWYETLFRRVPPKKWGIDFSTTNYTVTNRGYAAMADAAEDSRAIIILRDPIDRLWSHLKFHAEITGDVNQISNWSVDQLRSFAVDHKLISGSFYADAIGHMNEHFPPERRMVVNFADLRNRPEALFADIQDFLGIEKMALPQRGVEEQRMNTSQPLRLPKGVFAHVAKDFEADLERLRDLGVDFVDPWIANAAAHGCEIPEPVIETRSSDHRNHNVAKRLTLLSRRLFT